MTEHESDGVVAESFGRVLGSIVADPYHPRQLAFVRDPEDRRLSGTPFGALYAADLRAWAAAFVKAAEELERQDD